MAKAKRPDELDEENKVYPSSGNVFVDMGMEEPEKWQARASLVGIISEILEERGLNQTEAAQVLGLTQGRVSDLLRGKIASLFFGAFDAAFKRTQSGAGKAGSSEAKRR